MSEKKTIRNYIRWFTPAKKLIALVLFLLGIGLVVLAFSVGNQPEARPEPFDAMSDEGSHYASLDVIGVSDWVAQYGKLKYYVLEDSEHFFCAALIPDAEYSHLSHQNLYFNEETDEEQVRQLTGMNKPITSVVRGYFMEALEIDEDEFETYFGTRLFAVGESPKENATTLWGILAGISLAAAFTLFLIGLIKGSTERRAIRRLEERGLLEQAAAELESDAVQREFKDRVRLGTRFLFGKGMGLAAAWDDVLWAYRSNISYYYAVSVRRLMICTADKKAHMLNYRNRQTDEICALMDAFAARNPEIRLGYSLDNRRAWQEACKQQKL